MSRLQSVAHDLAGTTHDVTIALTYNPASQIAARTLSNDLFAWTAHGSGSTSSTVNGLNQISVSGGTSYGYDARGNMTSDGTRTYAFGSENLLETIARPIGTTGLAGAALRDPTGGMIAGEVKSLANEASRRRFPLQPGVGTARDAFRHFYGAYALARLLDRPGH